MAGPPLPEPSPPTPEQRAAAEARRREREEEAAALGCSLEALVRVESLERHLSGLGGLDADGLRAALAAALENQRRFQELVNRGEVDSTREEGIWVAARVAELEALLAGDTVEDLVRDRRGTLLALVRRC